MEVISYKTPSAACTSNQVNKRLVNGMFTRWKDRTDKRCPARIDDHAMSRLRKTRFCNKFKKLINIHSTHYATNDRTSYSIPDRNPNVHSPLPCERVCIYIADIYLSITAIVRNLPPLFSGLVFPVSPAPRNDYTPAIHHKETKMLFQFLRKLEIPYQVSLNVISVVVSNCPYEGWIICQILESHNLLFYSSIKSIRRLFGNLGKIVPNSLCKDILHVIICN